MTDHPYCRCVPLTPVGLEGETFGTVFRRPPPRRPDPLRGRVLSEDAAWRWDSLEWAILNSSEPRILGSTFGWLTMWARDLEERKGNG